MCICRWLMVLLIAGFWSGSALAGPPEYSIGQFYAAAKTSPEMKGARTFAEHALITTPSYRVSKEMLQRYYFDPESAAQIKALLEKDMFVSWWQIDNFVRRNFARIHHVSLYDQGFILMQLENPQKVLILPVSLVTVRKSEQAVKAYLKLQ